jgi:hypothetical protein
MSIQQDQIAVSTNQARPAEIEQVLEQIGERNIADLRILSEKFNQFYSALLTEKDTQMTQLCRSVAAIEHERDEYQAQLIAQNAQIAQLIERAEMTELELAERNTQIREFKQMAARYITELQSISEQFELSKEAEPRPSGSPIPEPMNTKETISLTEPVANHWAPRSRHHFVAMYHFVGAQYHRAKLLRAANKDQSKAAAIGGQ